MSKLSKYKILKICNIKFTIYASLGCEFQEIIQLKSTIFQIFISIYCKFRDN